MARITWWHGNRELYGRVVWVRSLVGKGGDLQWFAKLKLQYAEVLSGPCLTQEGAEAALSASLVDLYTPE